MSTTINSKINHIFLLLGKLANMEELYPQDKHLQEELFGESGRETNTRTLDRYLKDIHTLYNHMIVTEKKKKEFQDRKVTVYRAVNKSDVSDILKFFLDKKNDLTWVIQMIQEQDPDILHDLESEAIKSIKNELEEDKDIFLFSSQPFELFTTDSEKSIFSNLKKAVKNNEYRTIQMKGNRSNTFEDVKCLKMIYSQNNWYIALETKQEKLKLSRIKFIDKVGYSKKNNYQKSVLSKYQDYFLNFENPMTLATNEKQKAILKVSPEIAKYFDADMKSYYKSQEFIKKYADGSIEFSIDYTQPLEILPFIKKWLPYVEVLSPFHLKGVLLEELNSYIERVKQN